MAYITTYVSTKYLKLLLDYAIILDSGRPDVAPLQFSLIPGAEIKKYDDVVDEDLYSPTYNAHIINNYVEANILCITTVMVPKTVWVP